MIEEKCIFNDDYSKIEKEMELMCPEGTPIALKNRLRSWLEVESHVKRINKTTFALFKEFIPKNNCNKCDDK